MALGTGLPGARTRIRQARDLERERHGLGYADPPRRLGADPGAGAAPFLDVGGKTRPTWRPATTVVAHVCAPVRPKRAGFSQQPRIEAGDVRFRTMDCRVVWGRRRD